MSDQSTARLTYRFRVKDKHTAELAKQARAVNFVWNFCQDTQKNALRWGKKWPSGYELQNLCAGSSKELGLLSSTISMVCHQYAKSRQQHCKAMLRWRGKKSLGWIPVRDGAVKFDGEAFVVNGRRFDAWVSRSLSTGLAFGSGALSQDARGRWYINVSVPVNSIAASGSSSIGIDLGLKELAALSTGESIEAPRWYRSLQGRLAVAQRANKERHAKTIHARIAARRSDHLHKLTTRLVQEHGAIFVGDVQPAKLERTKMAKSIYDAGWSRLRQQLAYKAIRHGALYQEVDERWTTQACNACGVIAGPKGRAGLNEREWTCVGCGADHDRDINAARNILARGLASLVEGAAT